MEKRPSLTDDKYFELLADKLAPEVVKWFEQNGDVVDVSEVKEELTCVLSNVFIDCDGYKVAKELEQSFSYDADSELVAILSENINFYSSDVLSQMTKKWAEDNNVKIELKIGDTVKVKCHSRKNDKLEEFVGEIVNVYEDSAKYSVYIEELGHVRRGIGTHGMIVNCEDVVKI